MQLFWTSLRPCTMRRLRPGITRMAEVRSSLMWQILSDESGERELTGECLRYMRGAEDASRLHAHAGGAQSSSERCARLFANVSSVSALILASSSSSARPLAPSSIGSQA